MDQHAQATAQPIAQAGPRLYTQADVSERCRLSRSHIYNLMQRGKFPQPAVRMGTRFTRWAACDVDGWIADPQGWIEAHSQASEGTV